MKLCTIFVIALLLIGCGFKPHAAPGSEMTYNGEYYVLDNRTDSDLRIALLNTCDNLRCNLIKDNPSSSAGGFFLVAEISENEEIWLIKDTRNIIFFTIIQKKKSKFNTETLNILENLKTLGFEFKLVESKHWLCNSKERGSNDCKRNIVNYDNLDYIEFVKSNLDKT